MVTLFVRHPVQEFEHWRRVYDAFAALRREGGVTGASIHRDADNPNLVTVTHQCADLDAAPALARSEALQAAMQQAGVAG